MQDSYQSKWDKCLVMIRESVPEAAFSTWFQPIVPLSYEDKKVTVQVPSKFFCEYLEEKYMPVLRRALFRVFGEGTMLHYRFIEGNLNGNGTAAASAATSSTSKSPSKPASAAAPAAATPFAAVELPELDPRLNDKFTFDNFFEGVSNKLARSAGVTIAANPGTTAFNPLFLFGPSGVGKTHLCNAIGLKIKETYPKKRVLYVSANLFTLQYTDATRKNTSNDFLSFYQSLDVLIMDDIHEILGSKPKTQDIFFHIYNNLHQLSKQLILTCDKSPADLAAINKVEERVISRLKWGLTAEISRPDRELRKRILREKLALEGIVLSDEVFDYIADHVTENIRDLEGTLVSLMANASINNRKIDMTLVQQIVDQTVRYEHHQPSVEKIQSTVCEYFHLDPASLQTASRKQEIVRARQLTMFLAKKYTDNSYAYIGKMVGNKDHATVLHACKMVQEQMGVNKIFSTAVEYIEEALRKQ